MTGLELMRACMEDDEICAVTGRLVHAGADSNTLRDLLLKICIRVQVLDDAARPEPVLAALKELVEALDERDIRMMSLTRCRLAIAAAELRDA